MKPTQRLALCGWAANSGVGTEFLDALRHLPVSSAFVLRNDAKPTRHDLLAGTPHKLSSGKDLEREMERFIENHQPDTILTWEMPGSWGFPGIWRSRGIRWVNVAHWDWFDSSRMTDWKACDLVSPIPLCQRGLGALGLSSTFLPVPIDTDRFRFRPRTTADVFLSIYGYGGPDNRRGFPEILKAWSAMASPPQLLVRAQKDPVEIPQAARGGPLRVRVENLEDPAQLFSEGDVALQPSRYEGVGVTLLEAQACGLPVIAVDAEPMNQLAPDLLVPVDRTDKVRILGKDVDSHIASVSSLERLMGRLKGSDIQDLSVRARARVVDQWGWNVLSPRWRELLRLPS
jgi:glycosyltransferase involved in cell wall biosynthesis